MLAKVSYIVLLGAIATLQVAAQAGGQTFYYPGTNYPTQFTAINDSGIAVAWFKRPYDSEVCDPVKFGGPCLTPQSGGSRYGFVYKDGQFSRLKGALIEGPDNEPLWITAGGKILLKHHPMDMVAMGGVFYLLYDPATKAISKIEMMGGNGVPFGSAKESINVTAATIAGINSKNEL